MKKSWREVRRWAEEEGIEDPVVVPGDPHARVRGTVDGRPISLVVSGSKLLKREGGTRRNIRHSVRRVREGLGAVR